MNPLTLSYQRDVYFYRPAVILIYKVGEIETPPNL